MTAERRPVVLCILDGWGLNPSAEANAVAQGATPNFDALMSNAPGATLITCGEDVGLPKGQMGNSEVGHMNLGAGRIVWMDLPKIDNAIADGSFASRPALTDFIGKLKASGGAAHVLGLMSPGGVHAHQRHIAEAARVISSAGVKVWLHLYLDGRDTPPKSAEGYLESFEASIDGLEGVRIATVSGRFFAMDRDKRWERVEQSWRATALGEGKICGSAQEAVAAGYAADETDEFITPTVIEGYTGIAPEDGVFMTNFRADRAREILGALVDPNFDGFGRASYTAPTIAIGMVSYSDVLDPYMPAVFPADNIEATLGEVVSKAGKTQFRVAETEKYPHVTFFFNGGAETPNPGEERFMAPSPKVKTYDLAPEMAAAEVSAALTNAIRSRDYDLVVANFANPDMVGHTGDLQAAIRAVESVDKALGEAVAAVREVGGAMIVTADHGNCEMMVDPETGGPHTAHTLNPVPVLLVDARDGAPALTLAQGGRLADVAPTLLELLGVAQPEQMTGRSLLRAG